MPRRIRRDPELVIPLRPARLRRILRELRESQQTKQEPFNHGRSKGSTSSNTIVSGLQWPLEQV